MREQIRSFNLWTSMVVFTDKGSNKSVQSNIHKSSAVGIMIKQTLLWQ